MIACACTCIYTHVRIIHANTRARARARTDTYIYNIIQSFACIKICFAMASIDRSCFQSCRVIQMYSVDEYLGTDVLGAALGFIGEICSSTICSLSSKSLVNFRFVTLLYNSRLLLITTSLTYAALSCIIRF